MEHLNLEFLRTFVSIVELKGFNKAAEKVHLSQSAISMQMKKLEEQMGQPLFERKRQLLLTHHGEIVLSYARNMLELNDKLFRSLKETKLKGKVRIGIQMDFAESSFRDALYRFTKAYPEIFLDLMVDASDVLIRRMQEGKLDVILYLSREKPAGQHSFILGSFPLRWVYSPTVGGLPTDKSSVSLVVLGPNCKIRQLASSALNDAGISWKIAFSSSSLSAIWGAVSAGIGIGVRTKIGMPLGLKVIPKSVGFPDLPVVGAYLCSSSRDGAGPTQRLIDFVLEENKAKGLML